MGIELNTITLNEAGKKFDIGDNENFLRILFNNFIVDPKLFRIKQINDWDMGAMYIASIAIIALTYLIVINKFFSIQALSYTAISVTALALLKIGYRQYYIAKCKEHLFVAFAITACRPYLNTIPGISDFERFRNVARPLAIKDMDDAMGYLGYSECDLCLDVKEFCHLALRQRRWLSINSEIPVPERYADVFREDDPAQQGKTFAQFLIKIGDHVRFN